MTYSTPPLADLDERNASGTVSIKCPECGAVNKYEPSKLKTCMVESESALIEARELSKDCEFREHLSQHDCL